MVLQKRKNFICFFIGLLLKGDWQRLNGKWAVTPADQIPSGSTKWLIYQTTKLYFGERYEIIKETY